MVVVLKTENGRFNYKACAVREKWVAYFICLQKALRNGIF